MNIKLPQDFFFGAATSALQCEGHHSHLGKEKTTWDYWYQQDPNAFYDQIDNSIAVDFYHKYCEDIDLASEIGLDSIRFSLPWSRIIMADGKINTAAITHYHDLIDYCLSKNIEPVVCLFHFDMPMYIQQLGGWESRQVLDLFVSFAEVCFREYGHKVKKWFTHNEPYVPIEGCYFHGFHYPFIMDFERGQKATLFTALSSAMVINKYKQLREEQIVNGQIGAVLSINLAMAKDEHEPRDIDAADKMNILYNDSLLSMMGAGVVSEAYKKLMNELEIDISYFTTEDEKTLLSGRCEIMGINYYFPRRVQAKKNGYDYPITKPESFADDYQLPNRRFNIDRGWEIYPQGIYDTLQYVRSYVGDMWLYISENGMGRKGRELEDTDPVTKYVEDDERIEFVSEHLYWILKAKDDGVNVNGYHMWALMDNWSMSNAFKNKYGFLHVDFENDMKRSIKKSGYWIKQVNEERQFEVIIKE